MSSKQTLSVLFLTLKITVTAVILSSKYSQTNHYYFEENIARDIITTTSAIQCAGICELQIYCLGFWFEGCTCKLYPVSPKNYTLKNGRHFVRLNYCVSVRNDNLIYLLIEVLRNSVLC